jgi:hypothetical protein
MEMPDSPPSTSSTATLKSTWDAFHSALPVSYRVAIALDAFVLLITFGALILLAVYIRKQIKRRRMPEDDLEMKCCGGGSGIMDMEDTERPKKKPGLLKKFRVGRKKGHVRWTSSVEVEGCEKGEKEMVKMKHGSEEWETNTWGPKTGPKSGSIHHIENAQFDIGMRGGGGGGFRVNPLGKGKRGISGIGDNGEWKRGSLWKGMEERRQKERQLRSKQRIAAGYDGYRGN